MRGASLTMLLAGMLLACGHTPQPKSTAHVAPPPPPKIRLAILPAESDAFPQAARALTDSLTAVQVGGVDERAVSKVSLEVVQLSIECVESTATCFEAVGRSLSANRLLFAQLTGDKRKEVKVTVTLFDVDSAILPTALSSSIGVFPTEKEAIDGIAALVAEAIGTAPPAGQVVAPAAAKPPEPPRAAARKSPEARR